MGIPDKLLRGEPSHALNEPTLNLAFVERRVEALTHVMKNIDAQDTALAGEGINNNLAAGGTVGKVIKGSPLKLAAVVMNFRCRIKTVTPELNTSHVGPLHKLFERFIGQAYGIKPLPNFARRQLSRFGIKVGAA